MLGVERKIERDMPGFGWIEGQQSNPSVIDIHLLGQAPVIPMELGSSFSNVLHIKDFISLGLVL